MKLPDNLVFVDVETTGLNSQRDRIIEIGIIKTVAGKVVKKFSSLIDPQTYLPPEITMLTGIKSADLDKAPTFSQIADVIEEIISESVFVAHNARFDYGFLKSEFQRIGYELKLKQLCTVKLSRAIYPKERRHSLDALIERFNLEGSDRHRAMGDAEAIRQFFQITIQNIESKHLSLVIKKIINHPSVPKKLDRLNIELLPEKPGVYIFYGSTGMPIYVGKSINIKTRVISHFTADLADSREMRLSSEVTAIETEICDGEFGAFLREAALIKELKPLHNRKLRDIKEIFSITAGISEKGFKTAKIQMFDMENSVCIGNFKTKRQAESFLLEKSREGNLCEKLLGLEKMRNRCFKADLGKCLACIGRENPKKYNLRFDLAFAGSKRAKWPFKGPVLITEGQHAYGFDNWCYLGMFKSETWISERKPFDLDIFTILKKFISNPKNEKRIKNFNFDQYISE